MKIINDNCKSTNELSYEYTTIPLSSSQNALNNQLIVAQQQSAQIFLALVHHK